MWIARTEILTSDDVPEGVKMYFRDFAKESDFFGLPVLIVSQSGSWDWNDDKAYTGKKLGIGPSHTLHHRKYEKHMPKREDKREGVKPGTFYPISLSEWVTEHSKKVKKLIVVLYDVADRHSCSADCD
jgi:hypothetical protein